VGGLQALRTEPGDSLLQPFLVLLDDAAVLDLASDGL